MSACELGNLGGCVNVSMMYSKGEGTDKNPVAAKGATKIKPLTFALRVVMAGVRRHRIRDDEPAQRSAENCLPGGVRVISAGVAVTSYFSTR